MSKIGKQFAHYNVLSSIGDGGMGEVYLAEDTKLRRSIALKFLSENLSKNPIHLQRFLLEARAASALNHPNICTIYEIDIDGSSPYIAMEYIEGETLAKMIARRRRTSRQTVEIALQVADALIEAHAHSILHRDIKPANIIVNEKGTVKVLDFGLAKNISEANVASDAKRLTNAGMIVGTAGYMSPEQARALKLDGRSDVWSLGVCMYEMLTGKQPFADENATDILVNVLSVTPPPPSEFFADISLELERIVVKTLQRSLDKRYASSAALHDDLRNLLTALQSQASIAAMPITFEQNISSSDFKTTELAAHVSADEDTLIDLVPANNIPAGLTPIIGRTNEIAEILNLLNRDEIRLLTMTGIGGTGKTRLSQAVAEASLPNFRDGVFIVELSTVLDAELVISTIAMPLGLKEEGSKSAIDILTEYLRDKQILLVIDNFEQVVDAAPQIGHLLNEAPFLKILVTSRFLLKIAQENEFSVPPLALPNIENSNSAEDLSQNESVSLFVERAKSHLPEFALSDQNARFVAEICTRLDGLPLAIELAAARVRILSPQAILDKLRNRLDLLSGQSRELPTRQQTMRSTVEWSYNLLPESERDAFRSLAVFNGGFRLESAEAVVEVAAGAPHLYEAVLSLFEKSLLLRKTLPNGEFRFYMLEVVRDFALETLAEAQNFKTAYQCHAGYFTDLAEKAEPFMAASQSAEWLDRLAEEHANLNAAVHWSQQNDPAMLVRLTAALRNYWLLHGHLAEGYAALNAAHSLTDEPPELMVKIMSGLGLAARFKGETEIARKAYAKGLEVGTRSNDTRGIALSLRGLGLVALQQDDFAGASEYFRRGLELSRQLGDDFGIAMSLSFLGDVYRTEGQYARARPLFEESVELFRKGDNTSAIGDSLNNLGATAFGQGDFSAAAEYFTEALQISNGLGNRITMSLSLDGFGALAAVSDDYERSAYMSGAAEFLRSSIGYKIEPAEREFREEYIAILREKMTAEQLQLAHLSGFSAKSVDAVINSLLEAETDTQELAE